MPNELKACPFCAHEVTRLEEALHDMAGVPEEARTYTQPPAPATEREALAPRGERGGWSGAEDYHIEHTEVEP